MKEYIQFKDGKIYGKIYSGFTAGSVPIQRETRMNENRVRSGSIECTLDWLIDILG